MNKENWINEVLESTKGIQKAEPSPFLFEQINARIQKGKEVMEANPFLKWGLTTIVLIILSLNILSITKNNRDSTNIKEVATESNADNYFNNTVIYSY
jgi:hypothetical protein